MIMLMLWGGVDPPEPRAETEPNIHAVVTKRGSSTSVSFRTKNEELATMSGPGVMDVLAWIMAAIANPFTTVTRKETS